MKDLSFILHIVAGTVALISTFIAVPFKKGTRLHNKSGTIYFYAMTLVFITAMHLSLIDDPINWFLFSVGIFSYYMAFSGWRAAVERINLPNQIDYIVACLTLGCAGFMFYEANELLKYGSDLAIVLFVFGGICAVMAIQDILQFRKGPIRGKERIIRHLSRILPSVIAVFTAVLVVNGEKLGIPSLASWLGPTVILTPVITLWNIWFRMSPSKRKGLGKRLVKQALGQANIDDD